MQIFVKILTDKTLSLEVEKDYTMNMIKEKASEKEYTGYSSFQRLIYLGKELEENKTLNDYNIPKESTLYLINKPH